MNEKEDKTPNISIDESIVFLSVDLLKFLHINN